MSTSDRFYAYTRTIYRNRRELDEEGMRVGIERAFHTCMGDFPEAMRIDLFDHFNETYAPAGSDADTILAFGERLQRVVELFDENYEVGDDEFTDADWDAVREVIDDNALELDTNLITYVMRFVVRRGLFG